MYFSLEQSTFELIAKRLATNQKSTTFSSLSVSTVALCPLSLFPLLSDVCCCAFVLFSMCPRLESTLSVLIPPLSCLSNPTLRCSSLEVSLIVYPVVSFPLTKVGSCCSDIPCTYFRISFIFHRAFLSTL